MWVTFWLGLGSQYSVLTALIEMWVSDSESL